MKGWLAALVLLAVPALHAATWRGTVTHVTDGDTVWVRPAQGGEPREIRLLDLDAPEGCQAHGAEARKALRKRVLHQKVRVRSRGRDDYRRELARIESRGQDVGAWMVRHGHAWSMTWHGRPGPYARFEQQARSERKGLWSLPGAQDPRSFRQRFGRCQ